MSNDKEYFRNKLKNLTVDGGGDCPEMCFSALKLGLETISHDSYIYVMTDADEKDSYLLNDILNLVQQRRSQVRSIELFLSPVDILLYKKTNYNFMGCTCNFFR